MGTWSIGHPDRLLVWKHVSHMPQSAPQVPEGPEKLSTRPGGAFERGFGGRQRENPLYLACNALQGRIFLKAVASDSKDTRKRADSLLKSGVFGSGPAAQFMGLGLQFVLSILLFLYVGQWADRKLGTSPLFLILGVFTGATAAFYSMYRALKAAEKREEEEERRDKEGK